MRKMREPWSLILVALLVVTWGEGSEAFNLFPGSHVSILNNSTKAMMVKCEDRGGWDNFSEEEYRVVSLGMEDTFEFKWFVTFFLKFDIFCSVGAKDWEKKCDLNIYNTHSHYYDCLGDGCRWVLYDDHVAYGRIKQLDDGDLPVASMIWC